VLDPDAVRSGSSLRFSGSHIRWEEGVTSLLLFSTPEVKDAKLLVLAPHPDDAEIAAFALYSGQQSYVATVSAGNYVDGLYEHLAADPADQKHLRGRVRTWDSLVVPIWGGVALERIVNLGYFNGSLQELHDERFRQPERTDVHPHDPNRYRSGAVDQLLDGRPAEASWRSLVQDLQTIVGSVDPGVIATPYPAFDAAPDHKFTTLALLDALEASGDKDALLLLYTNHHVLSEYYPFGPSGSAVTLPPWFDETTEFSGVYSHSLTEQDQMDKLFALEAMHDLRAAPRLLHGGPFPRFVTLVSAAIDGLRRNPLGTYSYIRRAVRSNEIFFVVRPQDRHRLKADLWSCPASVDDAGCTSLRATERWPSAPGPGF
jgi:LmbE family N-acetylglucosaminyl deacetylase